jgi:hypothetical protein
VEAFSYTERVEYISSEGPIEAREGIIREGPDDELIVAHRLSIPAEDAKIWDEWRQEEAAKALEDALKEAI